MTVDDNDEDKVIELVVTASGRSDFTLEPAVVDEFWS